MAIVELRPLRRLANAQLFHIVGYGKLGAVVNGDGMEDFEEALRAPLPFQSVKRLYDRFRFAVLHFYNDLLARLALHKSAPRQRQSAGV